MLARHPVTVLQLSKTKHLKRTVEKSQINTASVDRRNWQRNTLWRCLPDTPSQSFNCQRRQQITSLSNVNRGSKSQYLVKSLVFPDFSFGVCQRPRGIVVNLNGSSVCWELDVCEEWNPSVVVLSSLYSLLCPLHNLSSPLHSLSVQMGLAEFYPQSLWWVEGNLRNDESLMFWKELINSSRQHLSHLCKI